MLPLAADVGDDAGDLLVAQRGAERRHIERPRLAVHFDGAGESVNDDLGQNVHVAEDPIAVHEGGREAIHALSIGLMARGAKRGIDRLACVKERLLAREEQAIDRRAGCESRVAR